MDLTSNLDGIIAVTLFLAGLMWSDYRRRGDRQIEAGLTLNELNARLKAVEAHSGTISKIDPLEAKFDGFKLSIEASIGGLQDDMRSVAKNMHELAIAIATGKARAASI